MDAGRIALVCGMPGAGKTTLACRLEQQQDAVRLCPDEWIVAMRLDPHDARLRSRLERAQWQHALRLARLGLSVVVEFGFWNKVARTRLRQQAREVGAAVELHVLDVPLEERWRRIEARNDRAGVQITRAQLEEYQRYWQPPDAAERAEFDRAT